MPKCLMDTSVPVPKCPDTSAPILWCRSVLVPKCPVAEVSGSLRSFPWYETVRTCMLFFRAAGWSTTCSVRVRLLISSHQSVNSAAAAAAVAVTTLSAKDTADKSTRRPVAAAGAPPADDTAMNSFGLTTLIQFLREDDPDSGRAAERPGRAWPGRALITAGRDRVSWGSDPVPSCVSRDRWDRRKPTTNDWSRTNQ